MATGIALPQLRVSEGENAEVLEKDMGDLVSLGWKADSDNMGLEASFTFPNFGKAADFITLVNIQSKTLNHHAETYNMHKMVYLHWTTHRPRGLSAKDIQMARWCHDQAASLGGHYMDDVTGWKKGCVGCENSNV
ncbi:transcriptional coactivator/pterin dehydratase [Lasiosphaeria ovina]|uniref:4a-hydroxytetrahydrobiopterin dehydratase n=1 Tax=Lasiosphaeria ovina TaxID=92902 RepID=A0AAE0K7P7_9PEZI|nr:transcriptional coactivator/pterin dehydratase [Lasiosphaeria ovina]